MSVILTDGEYLKLEQTLDVEPDISNVTFI